MPPSCAGRFDRQKGDLGACTPCARKECKTPVVTADLAQRADFTVAAIFKIDVAFDETEQVAKDYLGFPLMRVTCIGLERKRGWSYPQIVKWLAGLLRNPEFEKPPLVMDGTSMGAPVFDMFRELRLPNEIVSVTATGGNTMSHAQKAGYCWNVAKRMLVSTARTLIQQDRIKLLPGLELGDTAVKECLTYQLKISEDLKETYDAISGQHDDCVTCLLLAGWFITSPAMRGLWPDFTDAVEELSDEEKRWAAMVGKTYSSRVEVTWDDEETEDSAVAGVGPNTYQNIKTSEVGRDPSKIRRKLTAAERQEELEKRCFESDSDPLTGGSYPQAGW